MPGFFSQNDCLSSPKVLMTQRVVRLDHSLIGLSYFSEYVKLVSATVFLFRMHPLTLCMLLALASTVYACLMQSGGGGGCCCGGYFIFKSLDIKIRFHMWRRVREKAKKERG